ncbi:hypothetical protein NHX12_005386, partial [Muraenolepis orangiensis]
MFHSRGPSRSGLVLLSRAKELFYSVKEGSPTGTFIGAVGRDLKLDFTVDPPFVFDVPQKKLSGRYVTLDNITGDLYTSDTELDRETLCPDGARGCVLSLDVLVLPQRYFQLVKVQISVEDVNDNRPCFLLEEINVSVPENAPVNARFAVEPSAADPDPGPHGVQTYRLVKDFGRFTLDVEESEGGELTPFLIVTEALDRETRAEYVTDIMAEDGGSPPLLGTATLKITITDVNDNCPRFAKSLLNVTLHGNATTGMQLGRLRAFDPDVGANAQVRYAYSERVPRNTQSLFRLDQVSGVIKIAGKMDADTGDFYKLTVLASGPGCIPAVATVNIRVHKVVTAPPAVVARYIAPEHHGVITMRESEPRFSPMALFTVKNADAGRTWDCGLEGSGPFRLTPYRQLQNEYLLETTESLDYEETEEYQLTVVTQGLKTILKVRLMDENDNPPVFQPSLVEISVEENNPPDAFLFQLRATDRDSGVLGEVIYLLEGHAPGAFAVNRHTGVLSTTAALDREEKESYRFTVRALDGGTPRREATATVIIRVTDLNDNAPRFLNKDLTFFVPENFPVFGEIGLLSATDEDAGANGRVALSLLNDEDVFVVDAGSGALRARASLDRTAVAEVYAEDRDAGANALIAYSVVGRKGAEPVSFDIHPETGNVTLRRKLSDRGLYSLLVRVSDHGRPRPLHATVVVNLFVNETVGNESYVRSLLLTDGPRPDEAFPCRPVLMGLAGACLGLLLVTAGLSSYLCCRRSRERGRAGQKEVETPLNMKSGSGQGGDRTPVGLSSLSASLAGRSLQLVGLCQQ